MADRTEHRILCRDQQFDHGNLPLLLLLIKCIASCAVPIILSVYLYHLISKSVDYNIQAGTPQAWAGLLLVIGGSVLSMLGLYLCSKHNAIGNKFLYYIIDDNDGLYYAHMGFGALFDYVKKHAPFFEKVKSAPSFLYIMLYAFSGQSRGSAFRLAKMQMYFKLNQKYHFVEDVLLREDYVRYCEKVVAVKEIKYFSKGCEVVLVSLQNGIEHENKRIIYRNTTNYDLLMSRIKELAPVSRNGEELSNLQMWQIRKNICRRTGNIILGLFCFVLIAFISYVMYLSARQDAELLKAGAFRTVKQVLANRAERRTYRAVLFCLIVLIPAFGKMLSDMIKIKTFTCVPTNVVNYYELGGSVFKKMSREYRYFAKVKYGNTTVDVGMSKEMWNRRDSVKPLLVLRKNIPYCLIYQEP